MIQNKMTKLTSQSRGKTRIRDFQTHFRQMLKIDCPFEIRKNVFQVNWHAETFGNPENTLKQHVCFQSLQMFLTKSLLKTQ
jgi:hypothetical protein